MSDVVVRDLDRHDEAALRGYWEIGKACAAELAFDHWPAWEASRRTWAIDNPEREISFHGAFIGDRLLGAAWVGRPTQDNRHLLHFELYVAPDARRLGAGSALLVALEDLGRAEGRTTLLTDVTIPLGGDAPGLALGEAQGYAQVSTDECKVVDLPDHDAELPRLEALAAERLGGHALTTWGDQVPDEWIEDMCALRSAFLTEIPLEEVDLRPQVWTVERYRASEARNLESGRQDLTVAAVSPEGRLVGYTDLHRWPDAPDRADIGHTLVLPAHRGHRLGLALKVRLHQLVREDWPDVRTILTFNAGVNTHMNLVNEQLGYTVRQHVVGLQKRL